MIFTKWSCSSQLLSLLIGIVDYFLNFLNVYRMLENNENVHISSLQMEDDAFRCLVLSDQEWKSQRYSVCSVINRIRAANPLIGRAGTTEWLEHFASKHYLYYQLILKIVV